MGWLRGVTLRRKLPLLVSTLIAGALVLAGALAYIEVQSAARAAAEARLQSLAVELVGLLSPQLESRTTLEERVARSPRVVAALRGARPDSASLEAELGALRSASDGELPVTLVAADDRTVYSTGEAAAPMDPAPDPPLDSVKAYGAFREIGGQMLYWTSIPVTGLRGETLGWIAQRRRINPGAGGFIQSLIGRGVRISIGQLGDSVWIDLGGVRREDPPERVVLGAPFTLTKADGSDVLAVAARLAPTPWMLLLQTPMSEVLARSRSFLSRMLAMGGSVMLLAVAVAWSLTRRLAVPLEDLAVAAEQMAEGDYGRRVHAQGGDELARLARAFNAMSEQVARSDEALRHRLEEARALAERLEEANVRAERSREEAQSANQAKSAFLATMSHELRTPINAVVGYTELLEQGIPDPPTEQQRDFLRRIERSSRLLISLVDDLLDFSRIESGGMRMEVGVGSAQEAVVTAAAALAPEASRMGITLTTHCEGAGRFRGDQQRVQQILLNLLSNAVKFTPRGGSVAMACSTVAHGPPGADAARAPWVRIDVEDTGIGIDEDQMERVFEPFVQGKVGFTREHGGAGLGLAISRSLASMMSGELTVESTKGVGSRFTLWLLADGQTGPAAAGG